MAKKHIFGIFAHADDEAFGPSAYLYRKAQEGCSVHLVLVTDGSKGNNPGYPDLAKARHAEWVEGAKRIGATSRISLNYLDGSLCQNLYLEISQKISDFVEQTLKRTNGQHEIEFVTFEPRGITGHLDHIAVSHITAHVFESLKSGAPAERQYERLLYYCMPATIFSHPENSWIYQPAGYPHDQIDYIHDYRDIKDQKLHIMAAHVSQKEDKDHILSLVSTDEESPDCANSDHFIIH